MHPTLIAAIVGGVVLLFLPRRWLLFGSRWQYTDPEAAAASPAYVLYTRVFAVALIVGSVVLHLVITDNVTDRDNRSATGDAWDMIVLSDDDIRAETDPQVDVVPDVLSALTEEDGATQGLIPLVSRVVGRDDIGHLGVDLTDGDLLVSALINSCELEGVLVQESPESVMVSVTARRADTSQDRLAPCSGLEADDLMPTPYGSNVIVVRVPLDEPLGEREVLVPDPRRDFVAPGVAP
jgi:hypothetical protein